MKSQYRTSALVAGSLALILGGCTGDQVESGAGATGRGMERAGRRTRVGWQGGG